MSTLRQAAVGILLISFLTFIAFFGRLPAFRGTPIGFLYRLIWIYTPNALRWFDLQLTGGRLTSSGKHLSNYLFNEKHPLILIFFLGLITGSLILFVPHAWSYLPRFHRYLIPLLVPWPYYFSYLCARVRPASHITAANHAEHLQYYPYDRILYHPRRRCRTCQFYKPARSKHCSLCKTCVARCDHHCIWVNNCLGRGNYRWFLALLLSTSILLAYGAYLAWVVLSPLTSEALENVIWAKPLRPGLFPALTAKFANFSRALDKAIVIGGLSVSGVGMLALFTAPMPFGLLAYHVYLIWAGTTTNEASKWSNLREDMYDGVVFLADRMMPEEDASDTKRNDVEHDNGTECASETDWPVVCRQIAVRTTDGEPPINIPPSYQNVVGTNEWRRLRSLEEVYNVYDLGFWDNFIEALK